MNKNKTKFIIRKIIILILCILGILFFFGGFLNLISLDTTKNTVNHSYSMLNNFLKESNEIKQNHLCDNENFDSFYINNGENMVTSRSKFDGHAYDLNEEFNPPLTDKCVITSWRGEWYEYYSYPSGKTSLIFDINKYYIINPYIDSLFLFIISIICFLILFIFKKRIIKK